MTDSMDAEIFIWRMGTVISASFIKDMKCGLSASRGFRFKLAAKTHVCS